jgi:hypothetical protein
MSKVMFLDESGDHSLDKIDPTYPMFVLAGCIFDLDYYSTVAEPKINELKIKHFGKTDIILRSYDIRKQKGSFSCLVDKKKREAFYVDLDNLMKSLDFKIIAAAIHKSKFKDQYFDPSNPYNLCLQFILERAIMFLGRSSDKLIFRIESRETHNDRKLAEVYEKFRITDHHYFKKEEVQSKLVDLSFNQKIQNIAGHQIADLIAYPIGVSILDDKRENKAFEIIKTKFHNKNGDCKNYGLKIFP